MEMNERNLAPIKWSQIQEFGHSGLKFTSCKMENLLALGMIAINSACELKALKQAQRALNKRK